MQRVLVALVLATLVTPSFAQNAECVAHLKKAREFAQKASANLDLLELAAAYTCADIDEVVALQKAGYDSLVKAYGVCPAEMLPSRKCDDQCIAANLARTKRARDLKCF